MVEQLPSIHERQYQVQFLLGLERELERYDERVVDPGEDKSLSEGVGDFVSVDDVLLADRLKSVDSVGVTFADLHDLLNKSE